MGTVLLILLILLLFGGWSGRDNWGYAPGGIIGVLLVVLLIALILGHLPWGF
jgi:hypothetical protein